MYSDLYHSFVFKAHINYSISQQSAKLLVMLVDRVSVMEKSDNGKVTLTLPNNSLGVFTNVVLTV